jgi:hypothetical protein
MTHKSVVRSRGRKEEVGMSRGCFGGERAKERKETVLIEVDDTCVRLCDTNVIQAPSQLRGSFDEKGAKANRNHPRSPKVSSLPARSEVKAERKLRSRLGSSLSS